MKALNSKVLKKFLIRAADRLTGDWVIIGGAVLPLVEIDLRITTDIDMIPIGNDVSNAAVLELMRLAEELKLPIESINQAGSLFLERIQNYRSRLVVLKKGRSATIYRPNVTLFLQLKLRRLSETDLEDCRAFLRFARTQGEETDTQLLAKEIEAELKRVMDRGDREQRLRALMKMIT